ncbi:GNAT family N-acetyltransferase [Aquaspirillum serpens]|uniref:GNAT family N-acetyltransferase n=1 Tax=Aquaspirillum serpens TaxID=190 RepID=UPI0003B3E112|nr:GNAT family N-acetyltransferase [Aquaspirillum serpens]
MTVEIADLVIRHVRDVDNEVLKRFTCGRDQLDEFLLENARDYDEHGITSTVVVFVPGRKTPAGYFSLSADSVRLTEFEELELGLPFDAPISYYPAVKLTKLATASDLQSRGIGEAIVNLICGLVIEAPFAVRVLTVDAVNQPKVIAFYQKMGFVESLADRREKKDQRTPATVLMVKDLYL